MNHFISSVGGFQASQNKRESTEISAKASLRNLPSSNVEYFNNILNNSNLQIEVIVLRKAYMPTVLAHDAIYLVISGKGSFCKGITSQAFVAGDVLLADTGVQHFFDNYANNTIVWQIFYDENKTI